MKKASVASLVDMDSRENKEVVFKDPEAEIFTVAVPVSTWGAKTLGVMPIEPRVSPLELLYVRVWSMRADLPTANELESKTTILPDTNLLLRALTCPGSFMDTCGMPIFHVCNAGHDVERAYM